MSSAQACIGPHPNPRKPLHELPGGSTDCHCHVFEDPKRYPLSENRSYTPPYLPLERYLAMQECGWTGSGSSEIAVRRRVEARGHALQCVSP